MSGDEFIKKVRKLARKRGQRCEVKSKRGRGSHVVLYLDDACTIVKDRKKRLGPGLQKAMCEQLGIEPSDLN